MRLALASLALATVLLSAGCAAESAGDDDIESIEGELNVRIKVKAVTVVDGALREGDTLTVPYEATHAYLDGKAIVPYLAIALPESAEAALEPAGLQPLNAEEQANLAVNLEGDFPSAPQLLVTDADFRVIARARGAAVNGIDTAKVPVPMRPGNKFILVRDPQWDKPMTFQLTLGR